MEIHGAGNFIVVSDLSMFKLPIWLHGTAEFLLDIAIRFQFLEQLVVIHEARTRKTSQIQRVFLASAKMV